MALTAAAVIATGRAAAFKVATGAYPDLAVDRVGDVHIVYARAGALYCKKLEVTRGRWSPEQNTGLASGMVERSDPEVVVDSRHRPHVFCGSSYAHHNGETWVSIDPGAKRDTAMAIDAKDNIYICYRTSNRGHVGLRLRRAGTNSFVSLPEPDTANGLPRGRNDHVYAHVFTSPLDNSVHVVYRHGAPRHLACRGSTTGGTTWFGGGIADDDAEAPSGTVAGDGTVYVVGGKGTVFRRSGLPSTWEDLGRGVTSGSRDLPALTTDAKGNLYVTSFGGRYNVRAGGRWVGEETLPAASGKRLGFAETAGGPGAFAYVVWEEGDRADKDQRNDGATTDILVGIVHPDGRVAPPTR